MHFVDTQELRKRGLHREADVLDSLADYEAGAAVGGTSMPAARIAFGGEREQGRSAAPASGGGTGSGVGGTEPASGGGTGAAAAEMSGPSGGGAGPAAGDGGGGATADNEPSKPADRQGGEAGAMPSDIPATDPGRDIREDPLGGIYSDRMRSRIERDAFRGASSTAQDSEIATAAERLLPPELRAVLRHHDVRIDISPAARSARIAALGGEIPSWARGDSDSDPALFRGGAAGAQQVILREPAATSSASRVAAIDAALAQSPSPSPAWSLSESPVQAPREASSGREM